MNIIEMREKILEFQEEAEKGLSEAKKKRNNHTVGSPFWNEAQKLCGHWLDVIESFQRAAVGLRFLDLYEKDPEWEWKNRW